RAAQREALSQRMYCGLYAVRPSSVDPGLHGQAILTDVDNVIRHRGHSRPLQGHASNANQAKAPWHISKARRSRHSFPKGGEANAIREFPLGRDPLNDAFRIQEREVARRLVMMLTPSVLG